MPFIHVDTPAEHPLRKGRRQFPMARERVPHAFPHNPCQIRHPTPVRLERPDFCYGTRCTRLRAGAGQSRPHARAMPARVAPDTLFGEPGGLCFTPRAERPKLGQARRARQALVRKSERSTKCGDCGDESGGGRASIGYPWRIQKSRRACRPPLATATCQQADFVLGAGAEKDGTVMGGGDGQRAPSVTGRSRCDGAFRLILSETPCKNRRFRHSTHRWDALSYSATDSICGTAAVVIRWKSPSPTIEPRR